MLYALIGDSDKLEVVDSDIHTLNYLNDGSFMYVKIQTISIEDEEIHQTVICHIKTSYSGFDKMLIYQERDVRSEILNFSVDKERKMLLILTGIKNQKKRREKFIRMYDLESERLMYSFPIKNKEIIGRLKSTLYSLIGGHIYYGNKVIKIRFDLIKSQAFSELDEKVIFDQYSDILSMTNMNETIQSGTPLNSLDFHKLVYIKNNSTDLEAGKLLFMPYLHERRIYLDHNEAANQFYTIFGEEKDDDDSYIVCLDIIENQMAVYTNTGILLFKDSFKELSQQIGKPIQISQNA